MERIQRLFGVVEMDEARNMGSNLLRKTCIGKSLDVYTQTIIVILAKEDWRLLCCDLPMTAAAVISGS